MRTPVAEVIPSVLLVAMDRAFVEQFRAEFPAVLALNVAHGPAARERIPVTRPFVVVVASALSKPELAELIEIAAAVGAEVVRMPADAATPVSFFRIKKALLERLEKRRIEAKS